MRFLITIFLIATCWAGEPPQLIPVPPRTDAAVVATLATAPELQILRNPQRYDNKVVGDTCSAVISRVFATFPTISAQDYAFARSYIEAVLTAGRAMHLPGAFGEPGMMAGRHMLIKRVSWFYLTSAPVPDEWAKRFAVVETDLDLPMILNRHTKDFASFRERFEFARTLHQAGAKSPGFRAWAAEMKTAAEEEARNPPAMPARDPIFESRR